jgi:PAS domain S-box-containing protein
MWGQGMTGKKAKTVASTRWPAIVILFASLACTVIACLLVSRQDRNHIDRVTSLAMSAVHADLSADMHGLIQDEANLAKIWEFEDPSFKKWDLLTSLYIERHPGCQAIAWLTPDNQQHWVTGPKGQTTASIPMDMTVVQPLFKRALSEKQAAISKIFLGSNGERQWLIAAPIFRDREFRGFALGIFNVDQSLEEMLSDIKVLHFSVALEEDSRRVYAMNGSSDLNRQLSQSAEFKLPGVTWRLLVWSSPEAMKEMRSNLPLYALLSGCLFSVVIAWLTWIFFRLRNEIIERRLAEEAMRASQSRFAGILEISPAGVISTDQAQRITLFNHTAEKMFGYSVDEVIGQPLNLLIPEEFREVHCHHPGNESEMVEENCLLAEHWLVFGRRKDGSEFPMGTASSKLELGGEDTFTVLCTDVTRQVRAEEALLTAQNQLEKRVLARTEELRGANSALEQEIEERKIAQEEVMQLSTKLMRVEDEERRRLARELHDGAAQNLVPVAWNLHRIREALTGNEEEIARVDESMRFVDQCTSELRTISYLLHPPMLEELGLGRALRGYVEGFRKRSGIDAVLNAPQDLSGLDFEVELTVFRIVQEALGNVLKHSGSRTALVMVTCEKNELTVEIADQGRGIAQGCDPQGVGLGGMLERVRLLRGKLTIHSDHAGTTIRAQIPLITRQPTSFEKHPKSLAAGMVS